jgi:2-polyprenyl-6-hydroxyphenyl methylase / 3-demethylubiquinone-9 3-methyltransferase
VKAGDSNVDPRELAKFSELSHSWWDPGGPSRALHDLNPLRLAYVAESQQIVDSRICDVGCGGGLLSEALASGGADVVAIDLGEDVLGVARLHLLESGLAVDYRLSSVEDLAAAEPESFDAVTCMEMLEHVPDPAAVIEACARLLKPGGRLFLSTLNRTPKAFALAVVGAEYVLGLLPRGTHQYARFIRPAELGRWLRLAGLELQDVSGMHYNPLLRRATLKKDVAVNYLACALKPA